MLRKRLDTTVEKQLVLALMVSDAFAALASLKLDPALLLSPQLRMLAQWSLDYYKTYGVAPKQAIESIYFAWLESGDRPEADANSLHTLLTEFGASFKSVEKINLAYLQDQLGSYVAGRRLSRLTDSLQESMHRGKVDEALRAVQSFRCADVRAETGVNPFDDVEAWDRAFTEHTDPLLLFPGPAGRFLNVACARDSLIGIQAPEKRGKTFWALEFVMQALKQRRRVALFEVGDLSEGQILRRIAVRITGLPLWKSQCGVIRVPERVEFVGLDETPSVSYRNHKCSEPVSMGSCSAAIKKFLRRCGIPAHRPYLLVSVHPTGSLSVKNLESILDGWEVQHNFIPDVVVIDYADILAPEDPRLQARDQVNSIWAAMRRLSQERHCLVVAPTQADTESYDRQTQTMRNFSEDKRKLAHVTGMLGLNQIETEKQLNLMRLNWLVLRESAYQPAKCLWVAQCFALSRALCCSAIDNRREKVKGE